MQDFSATLRNSETYSELGGRKANNHGFYRRFGKRAVDISLVLMSAPIVIILLFPIMLLIALDGGNPLYSQLRLGRGGRSYRMWKLRSMVVDADQKLEAYLASNPEADAEWRLNQKLKKDPRITKIGRLIRKTSLDELPQLWNVLIGDMSLVGPRPMMVCQKDLYPSKDYFEMNPGITGAWQVSARNESTFEERATYDRKYLNDLSAKTDAMILVKTVGVVFKATGH
jgi:lipopolysaccharide/colanic/teichoic acid biosynthesis glycosyltransferase